MNTKAAALTPSVTASPALRLDARAAATLLLQSDGSAGGLRTLEPELQRLLNAPTERTALVQLLAQNPHDARIDQHLKRLDTRIKDGVGYRSPMLSVVHEALATRQALRSKASAADIAGATPQPSAPLAMHNVSTGGALSAPQAAGAQVRTAATAVTTTPAEARRVVVAGAERLARVYHQQAQLMLNAMLADSLVDFNWAEVGGGRILRDDAMHATLRLTTAIYTVERDLKAGKLAANDFGKKSFAEVGGAEVYGLAMARLANSTIDWDAETAAMLRSPGVKPMTVMNPQKGPLELTPDHISKFWKRSVKGGADMLSAAVLSKLSLPHTEDCALVVESSKVGQAVRQAAVAAFAAQDDKSLAITQAKGLVTTVYAAFVGPNKARGESGMPPNASQTVVTLAAATGTSLVRTEPLPQGITQEEVQTRIAKGSIQGVALTIGADGNPVLNAVIARTGQEVLAAVWQRRSRLSYLGADVLKQLDELVAPRKAGEAPGQRILEAKDAQSTNLKIRQLTGAVIEQTLYTVATAPIAAAAQTVAVGRLAQATQLSAGVRGALTMASAQIPQAIAIQGLQAVSTGEFSAEGVLLNAGMLAAGPLAGRLAGTATKLFGKATATQRILGQATAMGVSVAVSNTLSTGASVLLTTLKGGNLPDGEALLKQWGESMVMSVAMMGVSTALARVSPLYGPDPGVNLKLQKLEQQYAQAQLQVAQGNERYQQLLTRAAKLDPLPVTHPERVAVVNELRALAPQLKAAAQAVAGMRDNVVAFAQQFAPHLAASIEQDVGLKGRELDWRSVAQSMRLEPSQKEILVAHKEGRFARSALAQIEAYERAGKPLGEALASYDAAWTQSVERWNRGYGGRHDLTLAPQGAPGLEGKPQSYAALKVALQERIFTVYTAVDAAGSTSLALQKGQATVTVKPGGHDALPETIATAIRGLTHEYAHFQDGFFSYRKVQSVADGAYNLRGEAVATLREIAEFDPARAAKILSNDVELTRFLRDNILATFQKQTGLSAEFGAHATDWTKAVAQAAAELRSTDGKAAAKSGTRVARSESARVFSAGVGVRAAWSGDDLFSLAELAGELKGAAPITANRLKNTNGGKINFAEAFDDDGWNAFVRDYNEAKSDDARIALVNATLAKMEAANSQTTSLVRLGGQANQTLTTPNAGLSVALTKLKGVAPAAAKAVEAELNVAQSKDVGTRGVMAKQAELLEECSGWLAGLPDAVARDRARAVLNHSDPEAVRALITDTDLQKLVWREHDSADLWTPLLNAKSADTNKAAAFKALASRARALLSGGVPMADVVAGLKSDNGSQGLMRLALGRLGFGPDVDMKSVTPFRSVLNQLQPEQLSALLASPSHCEAIRSLLTTRSQALSHDLRPLAAKDGLSFMIGLTANETKSNLAEFLPALSKRLATYDWALTRLSPNSAAPAKIDDVLRLDSTAAMLGRTDGQVPLAGLLRYELGDPAKLLGSLHALFGRDKAIAKPAPQFATELGTMLDSLTRRDPTSQAANSRAAVQSWLQSFDDPALIAAFK